MANNIIQAVLDYRYVDTRSVWQYDYGQILRIQGENLPKAVEVHFSLNEVGGDSITKIGVTTDGITEVQVPDELLENGGARFKYNIYAFVYTEDGASGNTEYRVRIPVQVRPKPSDHVTPDNTDIDPFGDVVKAVNNAAERAEASEQKAKEHAASASESAVTAEKTKEDALRKVGEKKREAIEAIQNQATDSKAGLEQTITNADASKKELEHSIETAGTSKTVLDKSVELAGTAKTELDMSIREAGTAKIALNESTETAGTVQETLSAAVKQAVALDTSLGEGIETGTQLKTDLVASGEKAVQDIQAVGSEQLGKMQAVAEAFTADREQVAINKKDIGSLKEDIGNKAPAIIKKASGKTIIINDSSNLPIKILSGTGKIIITGKNILNVKKKNEFIPFEAKAGTLFTLITNGELSEGGNILFIGENDEYVWFAIDKGKTRVSAKIGRNVKGYKNLLSTKEGLKYCFSVGENDEYEEYVEQVITAPVDSEQLKAIHTNYPTTMLTSENEISVEYVADTEAYIGKRIKEENQSLQKQILEIQNALISQKISGV